MFHGVDYYLNGTGLSQFKELVELALWIIYIWERISPYKDLEKNYPWITYNNCNLLFSSWNKKKTLPQIHNFEVFKFLESSPANKK